jgi:hypothetical protein
MIRALLAAVLICAAGAAAQTAPQVTVALDPDGPVTVGTPVRVTATVLVPTWMPEPPVWPDLQVADAVTRLPERATHPVTQRNGRDSWSGVARTWEIIPQRPADYDLGPAAVAITYAGPATNAPTGASLPLPAITVTATVPPGAEGIDPFIAAAGLTLTATVDGLPASPKPGDAFTLTLTATASGPPAMLLPPLAGRLPALPGLRSYPSEPVLSDGDPATRTEAIAYVIEAPGRYALPALTFDWWNTATMTRQTATTDPLTIDVAAPPGWRAPDGDRTIPHRSLVATAAAFLAIAVAFAFALRRRRTLVAHPPTERSLFQALRRAIRSEPPAGVRHAFASWGGCSGRGVGSDVESDLRLLERSIYGAAPSPRSEAEARSRLLAASARMRSEARAARTPEPLTILPPLNPPVRALAE